MIMRTQWTIRKTLIWSFLIVAAITEVLGLVGYYGVDQSTNSINKIGNIRLPSMQSILTISKGQTAIDAAEKVLLCRNIDLAARRHTVGRNDSGRVVVVRRGLPPSGSQRGGDNMKRVRFRCEEILGNELEPGDLFEATVEYHFYTRH